MAVKAGQIGEGTAFQIQAVAAKIGFFKKQGMDVSRFTTQSGVTAVQGVAAGQLDVSVAGGSEVLAAIARGANIKIIASAVNTFPYYLVGKKSITSIDKLRGGSVAVSHVGAASYYGAVLALSQLGLKKGEYRIQLVGGNTARLASVARGPVDATVLESYLRDKATSAGLVVLADLAKQKILYAEDYVIANGSFVSNHPDFVKKYRTALKQARRFLFDTANEVRAKQAISTVIKGGPKAVKLEYEYVQQHKDGNLVFPKNLTVSKKVFQRTLTVTGIKRGLKVTDVVAPGVPITP